MHRDLHKPSIRDGKLAKITEFRAKKQDLEFLGRLKVESCA